jgi:hypothetical protein
VAGWPGRAGGACSDNTIVGGDGGWFELGRSLQAQICVGTGWARLCYFRFNYEKFVTWVAVTTSPTTAGAFRARLGPAGPMVPIKREAAAVAYVQQRGGGDFMACRFMPSWEP